MPYVCMNKQKQSGFIMLFFVLSISVTMLLWIGVSSSDLFAYIKKRKDFEVYRDGVADLISCADVVISRWINDDIPVGNIDVYRQLYAGDRFVCKVYDFKKTTVDVSTYKIQFTIDHKLEVSTSVYNGFVISIRSLYLL